MVECTCCFGCSVMRMKTDRNSFPKKLLVATSVVVIITMCLIPAEARATDHKHRHASHERRLAHQTKDGKLRIPEARVIEQRRRPLRKQTLSLMQAKETDPMRMQRNAQTERFKNATKKIIKKLKNTRRFYNEDKAVLNETKEYSGGMPKWLPAVSFVDIHFFNYRRRPRTSVVERKFLYLMPKLYKSLVEYQEIFERLLKVEVDFPDDPFYSYNKTRQDLIGKSSEKLYATIAEIKENMGAVNVPVPQVNHRGLEKLEMRVNAAQCRKNDHIAFRAYGNLLNNWYLEFRCPRGRDIISRNKNCMEYETKLLAKKEMRESRTRQHFS